MKLNKKMILSSVLGVIIVVLIIFQIKSGQTQTLNHSIEINSSPAKVWAVLNDLEAVSHYNDQVETAVCLTNNREGVGASRSCTMKDGSEVKERVIEIEDMHAITMELYESNWPMKDMRWRTALEENQGKTLVTQKLEYKMKFGALGALLNTLILKNKLNSNLAVVFTNMKNYIETTK